MSGTGGAFKSKGQWYQFSFSCRPRPDHMQVQSFSYQIGEPIPQEEWEENGLWWRRGRDPGWVPVFGKNHAPPIT